MNDLKSIRFELGVLAYQLRRHLLSRQRMGLHWGSGTPPEWLGWERELLEESEIDWARTEPAPTIQEVVKAPLGFEWKGEKKKREALEERVIPAEVQEVYEHLLEEVQAFCIEVHAGAEQTRSLERLKAEIRRCKACPFRSEGGPVMGTGPRHADLMVLSSIPDSISQQAGKPFRHKASAWVLAKMVQAMGLNPKEVYWTYALKSRPLGRRPTRKEIYEHFELCEKWLIDELEVVRPKAILCLGSLTYTMLFRMARAESGEIHKWRGQWTEYRGFPLMPTFSVAQILGDSEEVKSRKRLMWKHELKSLMARLKL